MDVELASVSVGCNKSANCLDWGGGALLAYGAHNQVVLYDDEVRGACRGSCKACRHVCDESACS